MLWRNSRCQKMSEGWRAKPFGELYECPSKNGLTAPRSVRGRGVKLVNMKEMFAFDFIDDQEMELAPLPERNPEDWLLAEGDLLFARQSLTLEGAGRCVLVRDALSPRTFESHIIRVRLNSRTCDPSFYFYWFRSPRGRWAIGTIVEQVAAAGIRASDLRGLSVDVPPLGQQRGIAAVLGALDDLIETNGRLCESLSSLVRAAFWSVFKDLRPELKPSWGLGTFTDLVDVVGGGTPNTQDEDAWGGDIPWYSVVDAPEPFEMWCLETEKTITPEGLRGSSTRQLPTGATIISARGTVGRLALVGVPMAFNQSCYGLVSRFDAPIFTYFATEALVGQLQRMAHGSVFSTITRGTLDAVPIALPPTSVVKDFESRVKPLAQAIHGYLTENIQLRRTRDELLPLLMSGRVTPEEVDLGV